MRDRILSSSDHANLISLYQQDTAGAVTITKKIHRGKKASNHLEIIARLNRESHKNQY